MQPDIQVDATGDGVTDDTAAILAAIAAATVSVSQDGVNRTVKLSSGTFQISGQLLIPTGVRLIGEGSRNTRIRVASSFTGLTTTGAIRLGDVDYIFSSSVEDIMLECSGIADSVGIYSAVVQGASGVRNVLVNNFRGYGIRFDGSASTFASINGFFIEQVECYKASADGTSGVGISVETGSFGGLLTNCTVTGAESHPLLTGIQVLNIPAFIRGAYCDIKGETGVLFGPGSSGSIEGLVTQEFTTALSITTVGRVHAVNINRNGGTNTIVDAGNGGSTPTTITSGNYPLYVRGESTQVDGLVNVGQTLQSPKTLTDAATVNFSCANGSIYRLAAGGNRTINGPSNAKDTQQIIIEVQNNTGGAISVSWAPQYLLNTTWVSPAATKRRVIAFQYSSAVARWYEMWRTLVDN